MNLSFASPRVVLAWLLFTGLLGGCGRGSGARNGGAPGTTGSAGTTGNAGTTGTAGATGSAGATADGGTTGAAGAGGGLADAGTPPPIVPAFAATAREIAAEYTAWGRVDDELRWAPFLCRIPLP